MTTAHAVAYSNVSKRYGGETVLLDIDAVLPQGQAMALLGRNGAGKSTLLKLLLDLAALNSGEIEIFGRSHRKASSRRQLAFLPEYFMPPPMLPGGHFLAFFSRLHGLRWPCVSRLEKLQEALGFDGRLLNRSVQVYSKGNRQKLALIATLLPQRPLLVLDEPMSGLDPCARAGLRMLLQERQQQGGSLLFSSHVLADLDGLADRLAILRQGRLSFCGDTAACQQHFAASSLEQACLTALCCADPSASPMAAA